MGKDIDSKNSIHFRVRDYGDRIDISWSGAIPVSQFLLGKQIIEKQLPQRSIVKKEAKMKSVEDVKTSFDPILNSEIKVLILGSIPSDTSIAKNEYYAHPRNKFWKIISALNNTELPENYKNKIHLLLDNKIGIWDVAHKANRKGSLDSNIKNETPNDLDRLIQKSKKLRIIGFNGQKSEAMFDKYFDRKKGINYVLLPSSSPANTGKSFENICRIWQQLLEL